MALETERRSERSGRDGEWRWRQRLKEEGGRQTDGSRGEKNEAGAVRTMRRSMRSTRGVIVEGIIGENGQGRSENG